MPPPRPSAVLPAAAVIAVPPRIRERRERMPMGQPPIECVPSRTPAGTVAPCGGQGFTTVASAAERPPTPAREHRQGTACAEQAERDGRRPTRVLAAARQRVD